MGLGRVVLAIGFGWVAFLLIPPATIWLDRQTGSGSQWQRLSPFLQAGAIALAVLLLVMGGRRVR